MFEPEVISNPNYRQPTYEDVANKISAIRPSKSKPGFTSFVYDGRRMTIPTPNPEKFVLSDNKPGQLHIAVHYGRQLIALRRAPQAFRIIPRTHENS